MLSKDEVSVVCDFIKAPLRPAAVIPEGAITNGSEGQCLEKCFTCPSKARKVRFVNLDAFTNPFLLYRHVEPIANNAIDKA